MRRPVVVKFGSSLIVGPDGRLRRSLLRHRAREIAELIRTGTPVCVVSSGAIALGVARLGSERRLRRLPRLQAASALGQTRLQAAWEDALGREGLQAAQILLTAREIADRTAYVNARNAFDALHALGAVPIVNENDATATDEISFGDNDALAAQVAVLTSARLLVLLTEAEGVLTRAPGEPGAELIPDGASIERAVIGQRTRSGRGGMESKIVAARMAAEAGIPTVIAGGTGKEVLGPIIGGNPRGTLFAPPGDERPSAFKLWLRFGTPAVGRLHVDEGARRAVAQQGRSLLAVGVVSCEGSFDAGDGVELVGPDGIPFAKGLAAAGSAELASRPRGIEAVHRDRLAIY
jgi:glutamate 5-kinase